MFAFSALCTNSSSAYCDCSIITKAECDVKAAMLDEIVWNWETFVVLLVWWDHDVVTCVVWLIIMVATMLTHVYHLIAYLTLWWGIAFDLLLCYCFFYLSYISSTDLVLQVQHCLRATMTIAIVITVSTIENILVNLYIEACYLYCIGSFESLLYSKLFDCV